MRTVAVLFTMPGSVYETLPAVECYDAARDALTFNGRAPVVAHPPCRAWGRLRAFAQSSPREKDLAPWAVAQVRRCGGVLEHPAFSSLWKACELPFPGQTLDSFGGFTLDLDQFWFGHRARKRTWLYVVGIPRAAVPPFDFALGDAPAVVATGHGMRAGQSGYRKHISKAERSATPSRLARWLVTLARLTAPG